MFNLSLAAAIESLAAAHPNLGLDVTVCLGYIGGQITGKLKPSVPLLLYLPRSAATNAALIGRFGDGFGEPIAHNVDGAIVADPDPANGVNNRGWVDGEHVFTTLDPYLRGLLGLPPNYQWTPADMADLNACYNARKWIQGQLALEGGQPAKPVVAPVQAPIPVSPTPPIVVSPPLAPLPAPIAPSPTPSPAPNPLVALAGLFPAGTDIAKILALYSVLQQLGLVK